jgi:perosamine synthetase
MNASDATDAGRSTETYRQSVHRNFSFLKKTTSFDDLFAKSVPLSNGDGFLVPVCELHADDGQLIAKLARWRAENYFAYPTQFPVTIEGTTSWLRSKLLDVEDRLLFLVLDKYGNAVGHLGYANAINDKGEMEIDNVVRGDKASTPGIMSSALRAALDWADEMIGPRLIDLRVFSDNEHAVEFYRRLGFVDDELIPLRKHDKGESIFYEVLSEGDRGQPDKHFLRMVYRPRRTVDSSQMILTAGPTISAREVSYTLDAARYGWNREWSKYIKRFEEAFARYIGVKYALSTSSCTGALHLALVALGIGPGDEVIVPEITWVATANAVTYVGATPVFADIQMDSWCLDPASFEAAITHRTRAVIPVHLYGHPAQMSRVMEIARRHDLLVIEDAAPAIGAEVEGRKVGTFGDFAAFSFQGAKLAVTGEGGILVTNDEELYERAYSAWDQGRDPSRMFWIDKFGLKYKMSNIQAALGLGQMERIEDLIERKRRIFSWYDEGLAEVSGLTLNYETEWARSIYWMSSILLDPNAGITRDGLRQALKDRNIDTRPVFPAVSQYPIWEKPQQVKPNARQVGENAINLPSGHRLHREQVDYICGAIKEVLGPAK